MEMSLKIGQKVRGRLVAVLILSIAIVLIFLLSFNWTTWAGEGEQQKTDDAHVRADVTPLSTKAAGIVASVDVFDYQAVKAGDLLVRLRDEDFRAQVFANKSWLGALLVIEPRRSRAFEYENLPSTCCYPVPCRN
jgi:multidrug resistance efflux pump